MELSLIEHKNDTAEELDVDDDYFNPNIYIVCKLCRQSFPSVAKLLYHKRFQHTKNELKRIKCIIFEERFVKINLEDSFAPIPSDSAEINWNNTDESNYSGPKKQSTDSVNLAKDKTCQLAHDDDKVVQDHRKAYVRLEKLNSKQLESKLKPRSNLSDEVAPAGSSTSIPSKPNAVKSSWSPLNGMRIRASHSENNEMRKQISNVSKNLYATEQEINDQVPYYYPSSQTLLKPSHLSSTSTLPILNARRNLKISKDISSVAQALEDGDFIVARVIKGSDGTHKFQFNTTRIPPTVSATVSISTSRKRVGPIPKKSSDSSFTKNLRTVESSKSTRDSLPLSGIINNNQQESGAHWTCADSRSSYKTRKRSSKINYCENQLCSVCSQDFDTVEELEAHEKQCLLVSRINNKSALNNSCVASKVSAPVTTIAAKNNSGAGIISLVDWLKLQSDRECPDGSVNVILLDPDPTSAVHSKPFTISTKSPVTCKLCLTKLETEPDVKNHAKNCWLHNKDRHIFCITCEMSFRHPIKLKQHYKSKHSDTVAEVENKGTHHADPTEEALNENQLNLDLDLLPLGQWIQNRKKMFPDVMLVDPDPTSDSYLNSVQSVKQPTHWSACAPLMCKLCRFKCGSEKLMKCHVQICWAYNKKNHVYCVPCKSEFNSVKSLESHQNISHNKSENVGVICCRDCHQEFSTLEHLERHQDSAQDFFRTMKYMQSLQNMKDCLLALMSSRSLVFTSVVANNLPVSPVKPNNFNSNKLTITSISKLDSGSDRRRQMLFSYSREEEEDWEAKGKMQEADDTNFKCAEKGCKRNYNHKHVNFSQPKDLESLQLASASVGGCKPSTKAVKPVGHRKRGGKEIATKTSTEGQSFIFGSDLPSPRKRLKFATGGGFSELGTRVTRAMLAHAKSKD